MVASIRPADHTPIVFDHLKLIRVPSSMGANNLVQNAFKQVRRSDLCTQVDPDIELMLRVKQGDEAAFDELCRRYRRQLTGFFYSLCWNYHTSEDCSQEVFLRVWLARERYEPTAKLSTYIFRIARNQWITVLRARKCRPEPLYLDETWEPEAPEENLGQLLISRYIDRRIRMAVSGLPEHYRLAFVLCHFQEMKYSEAAEILEIPIGTVKSRMSAAVRRLREAISDEMRDMP